MPQLPITLTSDAGADRVHLSALSHRRRRWRVPRSLGRESHSLRLERSRRFRRDADRPDARFDAMGLVLLLDRCDIIGIDEGGADLIASPEARLRYRRRPPP